MIRFIAATDSKLGIANDHGIPWQGKLPNEVAYFRSKTLHGTVMMGHGWYREQLLPLPERRNIVATTSDEAPRPGFEKVTDARSFLRTTSDDIWVGGGAGLFESTLDLADELYITRIEADFRCTRFFPEFETQFELASKSESQEENGIRYCFEVWRKKLS